jgi:hypothetical protein
LISRVVDSARCSSLCSMHAALGCCATPPRARIPCAVCCPNVVSSVLLIHAAAPAEPPAPNAVQAAACARQGRRCAYVRLLRSSSFVLCGTLNRRHIVMPRRCVPSSAAHHGCSPVVPCACFCRAGPQRLSFEPAHAAGQPQQQQSQARGQQRWQRGACCRSSSPCCVDIRLIARRD